MLTVPHQMRVFFQDTSILETDCEHSLRERLGRGSEALRKKTSRGYRGVEIRGGPARKTGGEGGGLRK